jgi:hypothetical protein
LPPVILKDRIFTFFSTVFLLSYSWKPLHWIN